MYSKHRMCSSSLAHIYIYIYVYVYVLAFGEVGDVQAFFSFPCGWLNALMYCAIYRFRRKQAETKLFFFFLSMVVHDTMKRF